MKMVAGGEVKSDLLGPIVGLALWPMNCGVTWSTSAGAQPRLSEARAVAAKKQAKSLRSAATTTTFVLESIWRITLEIWEGPKSLVALGVLALADGPASLLRWALNRYLGSFKELRHNAFSGNTVRRCVASFGSKFKHRRLHSFNIA